MQYRRRDLLREIGFSVIHFREVYRNWCRTRGINYHEMLIFYTMQDMEKCTQKDVCDCYALPKQTVNNIVRRLKNNGLITLEPGITNRKERFLVLTDAGRTYSEKFMAPLQQQELEAVSAMGTERLADTIKLLNEYTEKINQAMNSRARES